MQHLKIAWRTLLRHRTHALINIVGLALGIACCLLIAQYLRFELSFDAHHENVARIVRLVSERPIGDRVEEMANVPLPAGPSVAGFFPEVDLSARLLKATNGAGIRVSDRLSSNHSFFFADPAVFDVFSFEYLAGSSRDPLGVPNAMVLVESAAERYFGQINAVGETVTASVLGESRDFVVTAVVRDAPANAHFRFDFLVPFDSELNGWLGASESWNTNMLGAWTYLLLAPSADLASMRSRLPGFVLATVPEPIKSRFALEVQPLRDIHLQSHRIAELEANGSVLYLMIFAAIAALVLLVACVNFVNLATALSLRRAKEIGMRKSLGARPRQIAVQFLVEALVYSFGALLLAGGLVLLALPYFASITGVPASTALFSDPVILASVLGVWLITGLLSGAYPALVASRFSPTRALRGASVADGRPTWRTGLVVGQFTVCVALLIGLVTILTQLDYLESKDLGFDKDQIVVITGQSDASFQVFKEEATKQPGILEASVTSRVPGGRHLADGLFRTPAGETPLPFLRVENDFPETVGFELVAGRPFAAADQDAIMVNETAVSDLGWEDGALGRQLVQINRGAEKTWTVIGVVRDAHFESLHDQVRPLVLAGGVTDGSRILVRVAAGSTSSAVSVLEETWSRVSPSTPLQFYFLDENLQGQYVQEARLSSLVRIFALLATLVACLGLYGLISFAVERRTQEIGIRKVLGASAVDILTTLSGPFVKLVGLSLILAVPLAFVATDRWLDGFAYRVEVSGFAVLGVGLLVLALAVATVGARSLRVALANPRESIRSE